MRKLPVGGGAGTHGLRGKKGVEGRGEKLGEEIEGWRKKGAWMVARESCRDKQW